MEDSDDIFGPPRALNGPPIIINRPSMISAKYKLKEERTKVLLTSLNKHKKLKKEINLCKYTLISNTIKRLQEEIRDEKLQKHHHHHHLHHQNNYYSLACNNNNNDQNLIENDDDEDDNEDIDDNTDLSRETIEPLNNKMENGSENLIIESDFHAKLEEEITTTLSDKDIDEIDEFFSKTTTASIITSTTTPPPPSTSSTKRSYDEMVGNCGILSEFGIPADPSIIESSLKISNSKITDYDDDKVDEHVAKDTKLKEPNHFLYDSNHLIKRIKLDEKSISINDGDDFFYSENSFDNLTSSTTTTTTTTNYMPSLTSFIHNNSMKLSNSCMFDSVIDSSTLTSSSSLAAAAAPPSPPPPSPTTSSSFSCGQFWIFSEVQSNLFPNLITSLET